MHRTTGTPALRRWLVGGASFVLAATMVGCGSDDDSGDASATTSAAAENDPAAFCEAAVDAESAVTSGPPIDFETATPEEIQAALEEFSAQVEPQLAAAEEAAPEEISADVTTLTGLIRQVLETGDDTLFEQPEYTNADNAIDEYMLAECGFEQIEATGVDYEYEGSRTPCPRASSPSPSATRARSCTRSASPASTTTSRRRSRSCSPCRRRRSSR